jgi:hypothetical protein
VGGGDQCQADLDHSGLLERLHARHGDCRSRQYGSRYQDETRIYTIQLGGLLKHDLRWLNHDAPRRVRPGDIVQTTVTVQNAGTTVLRPGEASF